MVSFSSSLCEAWNSSGREQLVRDSQKLCVWKWKKISTSILSSEGCCELHSQLTEGIAKSPCYFIPNSVCGLPSQHLTRKTGHLHCCCLFMEIQRVQLDFLPIQNYLGLGVIVDKEYDKFFCAYIIRFSHM